MADALTEVRWILKRAAGCKPKETKYAKAKPSERGAVRCSAVKGLNEGHGMKASNEKEISHGRVSWQTR